MWGIAALRRQVGYTFRQWRNKEAFPAMLAGAFTGPFLGIWLSLIAVSLTRLGIASTLMALPPVILIPVEYFIFKRPVSNRGIIGTLLAFVGVMLLFVEFWG
ncbi:MAG: DMT family transporter [Chloroflexi bacterium]|nr:DMT family transporter [Chloroflexota bacterium]